MNAQQLERHEQNLDAAYQQMAMREAQGENMTHAYVDEETYEIKFQAP